MSIQTVIVERHHEDDELGEVFFLEESPDLVKASITTTTDAWRAIYSFEEYTNMQTRHLSDFCPPAPKKGIWWLTVDKGAVSNIMNIMPDKLKVHCALEMFNPVSHFHVTLAYDVNKEDRPEGRYASKFDGNRKIGEYHPIYVHGLAYNEKCACLVVHGVRECCNKHPHITIMTADGVKPVYSNDMLAGVDGPYNFLPLDAELEGTLEFFEFN